jgi:hypothetical protein
MPTALTRTSLASMINGTVSCRVVVESLSTVCVLTPYLVVFLFSDVLDISSFGVFPLSLNNTLRLGEP